MWLTCLFLTCLPAQETRKPLTKSANDVFAGTLITLSSQRTDPSGASGLLPQEPTIATFAQLSEDAWRFDMDGLSRGREGDFWYAVVKVGSKYRFKELGYASDKDAAAWLRPPSAGHLLLASGYVLDMPLKEFLDLEGLEITPGGKPQRPLSQHRITWKLVPRPGSDVRPAFGTLEWFDEDDRSNITQLEYMFGSDPATATGVRTEVDYDTWQGRRLPLEVRRLEGGMLLTSTRTSIKSAPQDRAYYGPESFGLERPSRPVPDWLIWSACLLLFGAGALFLRAQLAKRR